MSKLCKQIPPVLVMWAIYFSILFKCQDFIFLDKLLQTPRIKITDVTVMMSRPPPDPLYILRGSGAAVNTLHFCCGGDGPPFLYSGLVPIYYMNLQHFGCLKTVMFMVILMLVCFRSGKGAIHVWNLTTRRAEHVLESHAGNSVIWLHTFKDSSSSLIR